MSGIANMLARGVVLLANAAAKLQTLQVSLLDDEKKDGLEHFESYGFTSNPKPGAEVIAAFLGGDRSHGIVLCAADRRYRINTLASGEVAIYTDEGDSIVLHRNNTMTLTTRTLNINATNIASAGTWAHTGELTANGKSLPHHVHVDPQGGNTAQPT
jgi:phage baseplate assembly protein V